MDILLCAYWCSYDYSLDHIVKKEIAVSKVSIFFRIEAESFFLTSCTET